ncbi:MAG: hypothetical protein R3F40_03675 [Candidatus Competibacteraceae bacterium]
MPRDSQIQTETLARVRTMIPFSGSYRPEDTVFLLKPLRLAMVDV